MLSDILFVLSLIVGVFSLLMIIRKKIKFYYISKSVLDSDTYRKIESNFMDSIFLNYLVMAICCCLQFLSILIDELV